MMTAFVMNAMAILATTYGEIGLTMEMAHIQESAP